MNLTTDPHNPVFCDLETASACDLKTHGGRRYAADPSTRILTAVFLIDGTYYVWLPDCDIGLPCFDNLWPAGFEPQRYKVQNGFDPPWEVRHAIETGRTFVAHNAAGFDALVWESCVGYSPAAWYDTTNHARAAGLPGGLDDLAKRFFERGKDAGASILHKLMTLERRPDGSYHNKHTLPGNVATVARYNIADVIILKRIFDETCDYGEPDVIAAHHAVNMRGVQFDGELAARLIALSNRCTADAGNEVARLTGNALLPTDLRSPAKVKKWLLSQTGLTFKSLDKRFVDRFLADPDAVLDELQNRADEEEAYALSAACVDGSTSQTDGNTHHGGEA